MASDILPPSYCEPPSYLATLCGPTARYACMSLSGTDKLRLIGFPEEDATAVVEVVDAAITASWGVQARTCPKKRVFEWKLKGRPWAGDGWNDEATPLRLLIGSIRGLAATGWHAHAAADVAYRLSCGRDTLFLRQGPPVQRAVFAITFRKPSILMLVDAPHVVQNVFITRLKAWYDGVHGWEVENGALKVHLKGQLWPGFTEAQTFAVRELLCGILGTLDELGYELVASMDFTAVPAWNRLGAAQPGRSRGSTNIDSWFFASKGPSIPSDANPSRDQ
ncbi:uncharacterized protein EHS24_007782 [Apiotrichum porosum]|uniref:Uncharacterized protein n=1 Tax=Apiotrichum porosum TaxID=105984 RepID=A0A427XVF6_9TREE|nr:uncharacterized protein EHS24_007782 [Apiotrichum porosum]RSH82787.1 hypothetical protein EHS24_007782 [Apiotrichum porosum]